ncbi:hypothetical protein hairong_039 [Pseudomonas phage hairong]|nr:hypothetical protein hairong_039 [Pseudomonas phage hairong]
MGFPYFVGEDFVFFKAGAGVLTSTGMISSFELSPLLPML